ncbi:hypothetical protein REPUB_Repub08aG0184200 [Reevesia pubescens]
MKLKLDDHKFFYDRWAAIAQWKESYIASLTLSNSSRRPVLVQRNFIVRSPFLSKLVFSTRSSIGLCFILAILLTNFFFFFASLGDFSAWKSDKPNRLAKAPSRLASFFSSTQDKCGVCNKTAYPLEKVTVEGENYHKSCFRCSHGGCFLTPSSYAALDGILYCKHHFAQLFKEKGSYNQVTKTANMKKNSVGAFPEQKSESESESKPEDEPKPDAEAEAEEKSDQPVEQDQ